ncbi:hypothetical protein JRO89_XS01G0201800 [Xanthoceras sorbifolium]|uniref:Uncharacterized protein n=1 Tax=Xanthoceras sorbifolium TaxID=99658 RepID=A0ABQ8IK73_9ROSI|nr:hypothetical protein JRO89_XS01G0201800 [Xanthoceras sorbifolium]
MSTESEYKVPLLHGLDSSDAIEEFLDNRPVEVELRTMVAECCWVRIQVALDPFWGVHCCLGIQLHVEFCDVGVHGALGCLITHYSGTVLKAIGQSDSIAEQGQVFARGLIPQIYAFALSCMPHAAVPSSKEHREPSGIHVCWLGFHGAPSFDLDYGLVGAALTFEFFMVLSPPCKETWTGLSISAFIGIWTYFKLTVASAVMLLQPGPDHQGRRGNVMLDYLNSSPFTTNAEVLEAVSNLAPLLAILVFFNGIQPIVSEDGKL